jgi:hypothetical protein
LRILDVLIAGQLVGKAANIGAALDIVLATDGHQPRTVPADMAGKKSKVDQREDVVGSVVVFGDAQCPAQLRRLGRRIVVGELFDHVGWDTGDLFGPLQRVGLDRRCILVVSAGRVIDKGLVDQSGMDDLATEGIRQRDIGTDIDAKPDISELCRGGPAGINRVHLGPATQALEQVMKEDRMCIARI